jgi:hypothetical protein
MTAQLHFSNLAPNAAKGTLLSIESGDHVFTQKETMSQFLAAGNAIEEWEYIFSLVIISDKEKDELDYLLNDVRLDTETGNYIQKYKFKEPDFDTSEYWTMKNTGQITMTFSAFERYIELT